MVDKPGLCVSIIGGSSHLGKIAVDHLVGSGFRTISSFFSRSACDTTDDCLHCDVCSLKSVKAFTDAAMGRSNYHAVVYMPGISVNSITHRLSEEDWQKVIDVNLSGAFRVARCYLPHMKAAGWGRFIFAGSVTSRAGVAGTSAYSAAKAGLCGLSRTISAEYSRSGITSNVLEIGYMDAGLTLTIPENIRSGIEEGIPAGRFGSPSAIAEAIEYLIRADYVTGTILSITGGL